MSAVCVSESSFAGILLASLLETDMDTLDIVHCHALHSKVHSFPYFHHPPRERLGRQPPVETPLIYLVETGFQDRTIDLRRPKWGISGSRLSSCLEGERERGGEPTSRGLGACAGQM